MYLVRRTFKTKPGEARRVAELVYKLANIYQDAGQRGEVHVAFNGGTVPGETNVVILEWTEEAYRSPFRGDNALPEDAEAAGAEYRPYIESTHIEFWELLSPDKIRD